MSKKIWRDGRVVVAAMRLYRTDQLCVAEVNSEGYEKACAHRENALRNLLIACAMKAKI